MIHLYVTVRLHGSVVEDRLCVVRDTIRLGDGRDAEVCFPDADILVQRVEDRLLVRGRWLGEGDVLSIALGAVEVAMEVTVPLPSARRPDWTPDVRLLVATVAVALTGSWWDAVSRFVELHPAATQQVAEMLVQPFGDGAPALDPTGDGPRNARLHVAEPAVPEPDEFFDLDLIPLDRAPAAREWELHGDWPPAVYLSVDGRPVSGREEWGEPRSTQDPSTP